MEKPSGGHESPAVAPEPVVLPDVATEPHPVTPAAGPVQGDVPKAGGRVPREAQPEGSEAARKAGQAGAVP
jgi:hypothetical protein